MLAPTDSTLTCAQCGAALPAGAVTCPACGAAAPRVAVPAALAGGARQFTGRLWALTRVHDWLADTAGERFLLITGEPGAGKTTLAAWLAGAGPAPAQPDARAQLVRVRAAWSAAHFCQARGHGGTIEPISFTQALVRQLTTTVPGFADAARRHLAPELNIDIAVEKNLGQVIGAQIGRLVIGGRHPREVYTLSVLAPLSDLGLAQPGLQVFILVDALDEAILFTGKETIAGLLADLGDLPTGVRFLISCRSNVQEVIDLFPDARRLDLSRDDTQANERDLRDYAEARLWALPNGAPEDVGTLAAQLATQAQGNFLYLAFLLDEVARSARALDSIAGLPAGLYGLYRGYLERVLGQKGDVGRRWAREYEPLLGAISVAAPTAPAELLPPWLDWKQTTITTRLARVAQLTERVAGPEGGYQLYHRSLADFLAAPAYEEQGQVRQNVFYAEPRLHHARVARYYLDRARAEWNGDWRQPKWEQEEHPYPLRQLVGHLAARQALTDAVRPPLPRAERQRAADELYALVLDPTFRAAKARWARTAVAPLPDLRAALETALARDDLLPALRLAATYRALTRGTSVTEAIFVALDDPAGPNFDRVFELADQYGPAPRLRGRWARALHLYLAWEAAARGRPEDAQRAAASAGQLALAPHADQLQLYESLGEALLVRTARALAQGGDDVREWLVRLAPGTPASPLRERLLAPQPLDAAQRAQAQQALDQVIDNLKSITAAGEPNSELQAWRVSTIKDELLSLMPFGDGQSQLAEILRLVRIDPYPRYRDVMLIALGVAAAAAPIGADAWVRERMRDLLRAGLDDEGVTFTLELPAVIYDEAQRRGMAAPGLADYLSRGANLDDRWGTALRVQMARAVARHWQGDEDGALAALVAAPPFRGGYAGYASVALLMLYTRCQEIGAQDVAAEPAWGFSKDRPLLDAAYDHAEHVNDWEFRQERMALVEQYRGWLAAPPPHLAAVRATLETIADPDSRRAYKDLAGARWAAAQPPFIDGVKGLIPMFLADSSGLDLALARLVGLHIRQHHAGERQLNDAELAQLIAVCDEHFTSGNSWERDRLAAWPS